MIKKISQPAWWNQSGRSVTVGKANRKEVHIIRKTDELVIRKSFNTDGSTYKVYYCVKASGGFFSATICLSDEEASAAFGFTNMHVDFCERKLLLEKHFADVGCQGKFMRKGSYLNFGGPGVRQGQDPNFSIYLSKEVRTAVANLLGLPVL